VGRVAIDVINGTEHVHQVLVVLTPVLAVGRVLVRVPTAMGKLAVVAEVGLDRRFNRFDLSPGLRLHGRPLGAAHGRQQDPRKDADNGDYHQHLNQREPIACCRPWLISHSS